jgi:hypothetical protein
MFLHQQVDGEIPVERLLALSHLLAVAAALVLLEEHHQETQEVLVE